ncbi:unnamed protein product [Linum trigynum]|uniref:Uncharacterized protein n=1 Tax=Linum trigynum TaxID=586398 RepID=A0AAV2CZQ7_9ROSI
MESGERLGGSEIQRLCREIERSDDSGEGSWSLSLCRRRGLDAGVSDIHIRLIFNGVYHVLQGLEEWVVESHR